MNLPKLALSPDIAARFLGLMLVAWQPFIGGPRIPSFLLLGLGIWLLFRGQIDLKSDVVKRLGLVMLLLLVPVLISLPGSFHPTGTLSVVVVLILFFVVGLALMRGLKTEADHAWLQRWLMIVLLVWLADGYVQYLFGWDLRGIPLNSEGRIVGPFDSNLRYSLFITILMPIMLWRMTKDRPWLALAIIALVGFVAAMSGARSNMLYLLLSSATLLPRFGWLHRGAMAAGLAIALGLGTFASPVTSERMERVAIVETAPEVTLFQKLDHILSGRMTIWEAGLHMLQDRPLIGVGANSFAEAYDQYSTRADDPFHSRVNPDGVFHAHQMYVSIAAESGLPGLLGLIAVVVLCILWYRRAPAAAKTRAAPYAASLAVIAFPVQSQPVLYTAWWFPVVLLLLSGMFAAMNAGTTEPH